MTDSKTCFKCLKSLPFTEFYKHSRMADGYLGKCKTCTKNDVHQHRNENIEKIRAYDRSRSNNPDRVIARQEYAKSIHGIKAGNEAKKRWLKTHPIQRAASILVGNAVKNKKLFKPAHCKECGKVTTRLEGHHDDYAFPLSVRWLCRKCHYAWHKTNKPLNGDELAEDNKLTKISVEDIEKLIGDKS